MLRNSSLKRLGKRNYRGRSQTLYCLTYRVNRTRRVEFRFYKGRTKTTFLVSIRFEYPGQLRCRGSDVTWYKVGMYVRKHMWATDYEQSVIMAMVKSVIEDGSPVEPLLDYLAETYPVVAEMVGRLVSS